MAVFSLIPNCEGHTWQARVTVGQQTFPRGSLSLLGALRVRVWLWATQAGGLLLVRGGKHSRLAQQRSTLSGIHRGSGLSSPGSNPRLGPGLCQGRLPAALPGAAPHMSRERQEAGPSDTYLSEAAGEESLWDAFTSPLRRRPAGAHGVGSSEI